MKRQPLVQLIYASQMTEVFTMDALVRLMEGAQVANRARGISGFLCFGSLRFLQLLEGPPETVNALYARIIRDPRHGRVQLIDYSVIQARSFGQWDMGYADLAQTMTQATLEGLVSIAPDGEFDPYALSREAAFFVLKTLAQHASVTATGGKASPERVPQPWPGA